VNKGFFGIRNDGTWMGGGGGAKLRECVRAGETLYGRFWEGD